MDDLHAIFNSHEAENPFSDYNSVPDTCSLYNYKYDRTRYSDSIYNDLCNAVSNLDDDSDNCAALVSRFTISFRFNGFRLCLVGSDSAPNLRNVLCDCKDGQEIEMKDSV